MSHLLAEVSPAVRDKLLQEINELRNTSRAETSSAGTDPKRIEIHTLGWREDHAVVEGEEPSVTLYSRVFIDGVEVPNLTSVETKHGNDFGEVVLTLYGPVEIITHDRDSWAAL